MGQCRKEPVLAACAAPGAAIAIAFAAGFPIDAMRSGIEGFGGVPHRLELVRTWRGSKWYNDSIATAPEGRSTGGSSLSHPPAAD